MPTPREDPPNPPESELPPPDAGPSPETTGTGLPSLRNMSALEISSLVGVAALLLAALLAFVFMWRGPVAGGKGDVAAPRLKQPVVGEMISVASLETWWKKPGPNDRVRPDQALVPGVLIRLGDAMPSPEAYLKVIFRDAEGTIRGDVTAHRIAGGAFTDARAPERRILGTDGFTEELDFVRYSGTEGERWTVEILEGASYAGNAWNRLAFVTIAATLRDSESPGN